MPKKISSQKQATKLRKKCVVLAKIIVKKKSNYKCVKCGRSGDEVMLNGSHIYPEGRYKSMSADTDNILCLCAGCHMWSNDSWHENPLESSEWFHYQYPDRYQTLKDRSRQSVKCDLIYWQKKWLDLKAEEEQIESL